MKPTVLPGSGESSMTEQQPRTSPLRIPSVDKILGLPSLAPLEARYGRPLVKRELQALLAALRAEQEIFIEGVFTKRLEATLQAVTRPGLGPVINLTGTVIHTNLGRALMSEAAVEAVVSCMRNYNALEFDLRTGERGDRDDVVEALLCRLTGAEAATVVNNCAAAVLLGLVALGARREVLISRGEQIEIGGAFRMPDIMRAANCRLVEVGTTNRTHLRDFADAITEKASLIVKAHRSNYAVTGFTAEVADADLARLAKERGLLYMVDLGSGALVDMSRWGLPREPLPSDSLSAGADVVMFSGDKLLGGPQAGIIVGSKAAIQKIKKHPLKRALRVSKMVMAALEGTLRIYDSDHLLAERLPVLAMLTRTPEDVEAVAQRTAPQLARVLGEDFTAQVVPCMSQIGSGALPEERLASFGVRMALVPRHPQAKRPSKALQAALAHLRALPVPIVGRIKDDALLFDCRCLLPEHEALLRRNLP